MVILRSVCSLVRICLDQFIKCGREMSCCLIMAGTSFAITHAGALWTACRIVTRPTGGHNDNAQQQSLLAYFSCVNSKHWKVTLGASEQMHLQDFGIKCSFLYSWSALTDKTNEYYSEKLPLLLTICIICTEFYCSLGGIKDIMTYVNFMPACGGSSPTATLAN